MTNQESSAPPTEPVALRNVQLPAVWPTLLGVVSIVLGIIGFLMAVMTMASPLMMVFFENIPNAGHQETVRVMREWMPWIIGSGAISSIIALLLIIAGSGLALRRPWGVRLQKRWAIAKIIWVPILSGVSIFMQLEQSRAATIQMNQQNVVVPMGSAMESITILTSAAMFLWYLALPIFCLVWLRSAAAKREISAWAPRPPATPPPTP